MLKRILYLIILLYIPLSIFCQGSWEKIVVPTNQDLYSVHFTDSTHGWIVGDSGVILHTQDAGENWILQNSGTDNLIRNVFFLNRNLGWAASWNYTGGFFGTLLLKTTDGGQNWTQEEYPESGLFMTYILYLDSLTGWMGGTPHALVNTTDGGQNWAQAEVDTTPLAFFPVLKIAFYDENYGYASGGQFDIAGVTWRTNNGGQKWYPISNADAPADEIHGLHLFDSINVIGSGGDPDFGYGVAMIRTNDGGENWEYEELTFQGNAHDLDFRTETDAWAPLGPRQKLIYSEDAGTTWEEITTPDNVAIFEMCFADSLHGFGVGDDGAVIRYIPTYVSIESRLESIDLVKIHVTPNPIRDIYHVTWNMDHLSSGMYHGSGNMYHCEVVRVLLRSLDGKINRVLHEASFSKGEHKISGDISDIPAGVYIISIEVSSGQNRTTHSQKVLVL